MPVRSKVLKPDCRACGLCCAALYADNESWADLTDEDIAALPKRWKKYALPVTPGWAFTENHYAFATKYDKDGNTVCVGLKGTLARKVSCALYENRPSVCRDSIQPGNKDCKTLRSKYAMLFRGT